jgi:hypothetical protein
MRIAIISAVSSDWDRAGSLVDELGPALSSVSGLDPSIWLVDDGSPDRPISWNGFHPAASRARVNVLELHGRHGPSRALTTALGYLVCERDEQFDAFILLEDGHPSDARHINALLENSYIHPGSVIFGKVDMHSLSLFRRLSRRWLHFLTRTLSGERLENSTLTFLPLPAAEALAHSCHSGSHVEAAVRRLQLAFVCTKAARAAARPAGSLAMLEGLSVFRERVFARAFTATSILFVFSFLLAIGLTALRIAQPSAISLGVLALHWMMPLLLATLSGMSLLLGLGAQALNESRRWTPALDCAVHVRKVSRVKRGPEIVANC